MEYIPKDLFFSEEGRSKLASGIQKISSAVKSTLGPNGNTVLIESPHLTHGITVTKDGVTVAKSIDLIDPVENLAVRMVKEAADKTASAAGDGTTTSIVLTEALTLRGMDLIKPEHNRTTVLRNLVDLSEKVVDKLKTKKRRVSKAMLVDIASLSANNDRSIGKIISDVYNEVGPKGVVTVEKSKTTETYADVTMGLKIDRGYMSPLFANNQRKDECVLEDVMVLVADVEIENILKIENVLKPIIQGGKKLLILAPCSTGVVNTLAANVMKNNLKMCAVQPPSFGYKQNELMQDIAVSLGATYFSEKTGDDLSLITYNDLGHAARVVVSRDKTVIVKSDVKSDADKIASRVAELHDAHAAAVKKSDKDFIMERIASLTGGIGVIYVGGATDLEQKELYDRVDDAVCAVRSALEEGVLPGAGKALFDITMTDIVKDGHITAEMHVAISMLFHAMKQPLTQILANAGIAVGDVYHGENKWGHGYNLKTGKHGDLIKMGVIDPFKVTRSALQNAVSVATTILSTNAIVTMARADKN